MEDYNEFVSHRLSQLRESEENQPSMRGRGFSDGFIASSHIRFYGQPILPPVLSASQREEIQRHKTMLQNSIEERKSKLDTKVACIQNILHTVQLRKVPTLEEFFHEDPELTTLKSSYSQYTSNALIPQSDDVRDTRDSMLFSPLSGLHDGRGGVCGSPLTSTRYCALLGHHLTPDQYEEKLVSQPTTEPPADISHQSLSSGYVTYDNAENGTSVSARIETEESHEFGSEQEAKNIGDFFLHKTSATITKIPDIISHPPIDGEELEKCAMGVSDYDDFTIGQQLKDISITSSQHNSGIMANSAQLETSFGNEAKSPPKGASKITHLGSRDSEDIPLFYQINELPQVQNTIGDEETVHDVKTSSPKPSHSSATITAASANQTQIQSMSREVKLMGNHVCRADSKPCKEPHRLSLQALLKRSQEYRQQQRMIRNQAKKSRVQETTQGKLKEDEGLSDKENYEFPKGTLTTGRGKMEEKGELGGNHVHILPPVEMSPKKSWEDGEKISRSEAILVEEYHVEKAKFKSQSKRMAEDENTDIPSGVEGETPFKQVDDSLEVRTEPTQTITSSQLQPLILADNSLVQKAFYLTNKQSTKYSPSSSKNVGKFQTVPTPKFSRSPVCCKSKGKFKVSGAIENTGAPKRKALVNAALNEENKVKTESNLGQKSKQWQGVFPTTCQANEGDITRVSASSPDQAQQIHQLELNLSSLKDLISDLESTLVENMENHWQADYLHLPGDFCCGGVQHIERTDSIKQDQQIGQNNQKNCDYLEDRPAGNDRNDIEQEQSYTEWEGKKSDNCKNKHGLGTDPSGNSPKDNFPLTMLKWNEAANVKVVNLVETSALEHVEVTEKARKPMSGMGLSRVQQSDLAPAKHHSIMNYGDQKVCVKQQQSSKCITSLAQRMRIPYVFRKVSSNPTSCKGKVLSDSSNQPEERKNEMTLEGENSAHSLSLNQSYDVDTPSELWSHKGLGFGSNSYCVQETNLTPENQGRGQRGVSKAKRRLLMHTTEGNEGKMESGRAGYVVRPQSSNHKDPDCQGDKSQQLAQANAIQVRALEDGQRRHQLEQIQSLAAHYRLLQTVAFPCPASSSRLGDTLTSSDTSSKYFGQPVPMLQLSWMQQPPPPPQPSASFPECYRPLLLAGVKGFLTRRLLKTQRVAQLLRTIKDTQQFLQVLESQTLGRGEFCSRQDILLQERLIVQLRSAHYEVYDIFFCLSTGERMRLISWDRELVREREVKRQSRNTGHSKGNKTLSAATQKSLERKRGLMIQRRAAENQRIGTRPAQRSGLTAELPSKPKQGHFKANLQRFSKTIYSC